MNLQFEIRKKITQFRFFFKQEIKLLMRIQKKLVDLKSSDINNAIHFDQISSQDKEDDDINANTTRNCNNNDDR